MRAPSSPPDPLWEIVREQRVVLRRSAATVAKTVIIVDDRDGRERKLSAPALSMYETGGRRSSVPRVRACLAAVNLTLAPDLGVPDDNDPEPVATAINNARLALGLTLADLAETIRADAAVRVGAAAVGHYLQHRRRMPLRAARHLAAAVGVSITHPARFACGCSTDVWLADRVHQPPCLLAPAS